LITSSSDAESRESLRPQVTGLVRHLPLSLVRPGGFKPSIQSLSFPRCGRSRGMTKSSGTAKEVSPVGRWSAEAVISEPNSQSYCSGDWMTSRGRRRLGRGSSMTVPNDRTSWTSRARITSACFTNPVHPSIDDRIREIETVACRSPDRNISHSIEKGPHGWREIVP